MVTSINTDTFSTIQLSMEESPSPSPDTLASRVDSVKRRNSITEEDLPITKKPLIATSAPATIEISHHDLINIAQALEYRSDSLGICNGITFMGILAVLAGKMHSFNTRLEKLDLLFHKHNKDTDAVAEAIKNDYDCLAFFDGVELCHQAEYYPHLFEKENMPTFENDPKSLKSLLSMVTSQALESKGEVDKVSEFSGIYSFHELASYLTSLRKLFETLKIKDPIVIKLNNGSHTLSIAYDISKKTWILIDSSQLLIENIKDDLAITNLIYTGYETETFVLSSEIFALKKDSEPLKASLDIYF